MFGGVPKGLKRFEAPDGTVLLVEIRSLEWEKNCNVRLHSGCLAGGGRMPRGNYTTDM